MVRLNQKVGAKLSMCDYLWNLIECRALKMNGWRLERENHQMINKHFDVKHAYENPHRVVPTFHILVLLFPTINNSTSNRYYKLYNGAWWAHLYRYIYGAVPRGTLFNDNQFKSVETSNSFPMGSLLSPWSRELTYETLNQEANIYNF